MKMCPIHFKGNIIATSSHTNLFYLQLSKNTKERFQHFSQALPICDQKSAFQASTLNHCQQVCICWPVQICTWQRCPKPLPKHKGDYLQQDDCLDKGHVGLQPFFQNVLQSNLLCNITGCFECLIKKNRMSSIKLECSSQHKMYLNLLKEKGVLHNTTVES